MLDMSELLKRLAARRPVFALETDFQDALASQIRLDYPAASVAREIQQPLGNRRAFIDIEAQIDGRRTFFELKYKTTLASYFVGSQAFHLKRHGAQDQGLYDCIKDFSRLEHFVRQYPGSEGFAILLTNDKKYWSPGSKVDCLDREFKLTDGRLLAGTFQWAKHAGKGSISGREDPLVLTGSYRVTWSTYTAFSNPSTPDFRVLVIHVPPSNG